MSEAETNGDTPKRLSIKRKTIPIELEDDSGAVGNYVLKELTGTLRDDYLNKLTNRSKTAADGSITVKDHKGFMTDLIGASLYSSDGKPVPPAAINQWPSSAQMELFKLAMSISGLDTRKAEEEAKND